MSTQVVDVSSIVEAFRQLFARFAVPHAETKGARHNVEARTGKGRKESHILFRFFTRDNFLIELDVDMNDFFRAPEQYLDDTMAALVRNVEDMRKRRQAESRIILPRLN